MTVDILILSNGPGELATWVRPVVQQLRYHLTATQARISVILSPCPNATGNEAKIASAYPEVDRVQAAPDFFPFLISGKTAANWDWHPQGVVLFLGGDQFFTVLISKRLGYRAVIYAEWEARWYQWIDRFGVMNESVIAKVPQKYAHKLTLVGDLMAEAGGFVQSQVQSQAKSQLEHQLDNHKLDHTQASPELIGLLPGSKPMKLSRGVPLCLAIAEHLHQLRPQTCFAIPVAPTLDVKTLAQFADPQQNSSVKTFGGISAQLESTESEFLKTSHCFLKTNHGLRVELWTQSPAYDLLSQCRICLTTIGANTAELGSLGVPMLVLLPTQELNAMTAWDGILGIFTNLPIIGSLFATMINGLVLQLGKGKLYAWPNIWAKQEIVPELVGKLEPKAIAEIVLDYLTHPEKLEAMRQRLRNVRGEPGAAAKLAKIVCEELDLIKLDA